MDMSRGKVKPKSSLTAALLLLYCILTTDLLLWITNFPGAYHSGFNNGTHCACFTSTQVQILAPEELRDARHVAHILRRLKPSY